MRVIGTAGHVDHGKSTLVQALTGIHPDRLKEEREREMTIDLGFAWMTLPANRWLPAGEEIGIIDVPGHRDFIENMLSGVGGIDAALFVIAADEGVMPQTREHLAILDLLQVEAGVVALTKIDLAPDEEWLDLVEEDITQFLAPTVLRQAPIVRVSAKTGQSLSQLIEALSACLAGRAPRPDLGRPRLPVDRVFTIAGFGTVVTGTLVDGCLKVGDEVEVLGGTEEEVRGRVRGLQTHKRKEEVAVSGSRTAVNISGVNIDQVQRGAVVAHPGDYQRVRRMDVQFRLLPDVMQPMKHGMEVKLFIGSAEVVARTRLLGVEELMPGEETWLQLELEKPVVAARGDHYILRRPSPGETLGGGVVVDPRPRSRHKRFAAATIQRLEALTQGTPAEVLLQSLVALGTAPLQEVIQRASLEVESAEAAVDELIQSGQMVIVEGDDQPVRSRQVLVAPRGLWDQWVHRATSELETYHRQNPLRRGMPKEELKSRLGASTRLFSALLRQLIRLNLADEQGPVVFAKGHEVHYSTAQQAQVDKLLAKFRQNPFSPPTIKDCVAEVGEELYNTLVEQALLYPIPPDVVFRSQDYAEMVKQIGDLIQKNGPISAAQVRDHFNTSRRYVLAVLEHLDSQGITLREGDVRRLKKS
jgi:selenocysteine-specific elongation factor